MKDQFLFSFEVFQSTTDTFIKYTKSEFIEKMKQEKKDWHNKSPPFFFFF